MPFNRRQVSMLTFIIEHENIGAGITNPSDGRFLVDNLVLVDAGVGRVVGRALPLDPTGQRYRYDPTTGEVSSMSRFQLHRLGGGS